MSIRKCLPSAVFLLVCGLWCPVAAAGGQLIGLCCRDDLEGIVLQEILRTEGVPFVRFDDFDQLEGSGLRGLVLGEGFDNAAPAVAQFVDRGGVVLTFKPAGPLADALTLEPVGEQKAGCLVVAGPPAKLISYAGRLQLFGPSNRYRGGETLAALDAEGGEKPFGAIICVKRGSGTAIVASFDIAATLLKLLQPDSECGKAVDTSNVDYALGDAPQVDLLRRLVVGLFLDALDVPVMRTWYFPRQHKAMLMVLGDQDGADFAQLSEVLALMKELQTPYTLYVTPANQPVSKEQFELLADGGMEFALHPDFVSPGRTFTEEEFDAQLKKAEADLGFPLSGERSHAMRWGTFRETPRWAERAGLQYDAILGIRWWPSEPTKPGYWLGTGLPFYFLDADRSRRMDVLEIPTAGIDNQDFWTRPQYTVSYPPNPTRDFRAGLGMTELDAFEIMKRTLDEAVEKYYTLTGYCWHPHYLAAKKLKRDVAFTSDTHFRKCIQHAKSRGIGLTGSNALNAFWRARENVSVKEMAWTDRPAALQCKVVCDAKVSGLTFFVPSRFHDTMAEIHVDDWPVGGCEVDLFGSRYTMFDVDVGPQERLIEIHYD